MDTNRSEGNIRVIWEIVPGDSEVVFREFGQDDFDPSLFAPNLIDAENFPTIPHPLLNPQGECLDRVWNQSVIKINYKSNQWLDQSQSQE